MATNKKAKKRVKKKIAKTTDMERIAEYVSNLIELHKIEDVVLGKLDSRLRGNDR